MNSGLRAALGLKTKGKVSLLSVRWKFGLLTLNEIRRYRAFKVAWDKRHGLENRLASQGSKPTKRAGKAGFTGKTDSKLEKLAITEFNGMPKCI